MAAVSTATRYCWRDPMYSEHIYHCSPFTVHCSDLEEGRERVGSDFTTLPQQRSNSGPSTRGRLECDTDS